MTFERSIASRLGAISTQMLPEESIVKQASQSLQHTLAELDYRLIRELWAFHENRIAVRFQYEWHDDSGNWFRAQGNEQWEFDANGLMRRREASIDDVPILVSDRKFHWLAGPGPADHGGLWACEDLSAPSL